MQMKTASSKRFGVVPLSKLNPFLPLESVKVSNAASDTKNPENE